MAACSPSIHVFLGHPLFLLSHGIHSIINTMNIQDKMSFIIWYAYMMCVKRISRTDFSTRKWSMW
jgi:hypothetical protein